MKFYEQPCREEIKSRITKSDIAKSFKEIEKFGGIVLNFGDNRKGRKAITGKADVEILYKSLFIIEIKVGKDKFSDKQIKYAIELLQLKTEGVYYIIANEKNYLNIKDAILKQYSKMLYQYALDSNIQITKESLKAKTIL